MAKVSHILIKLNLNSLLWMGKDADKIDRIGISNKKDNFVEKISQDITGYHNLCS